MRGEIVRSQRIVSALREQLAKRGGDALLRPSFPCRSYRSHAFFSRMSPPDARSSTTAMQNDPHFRDYVLFHEYFHGDNGRGVGASHQTGWTGLVANLLKPDQGGLQL
jgi:hypothetical protein